MLFSGPDLTHSLISVLLRFRQERVAIIGDVECLFYQIKVAKSDAITSGSSPGLMGINREIQLCNARQYIFLVLVFPPVVTRD